MINFLSYLINVNICVIAMYAFYLVFLRKVTLFKANRIFLIFSLLISFVIPLISFKHIPEVATDFVVSDFKLDTYIPDNFSEAIPLENKTNVSDILLLIYLSGTAYILIRMFINLLKVIRLIRNHQKINSGGQKFVILNKGSMPFTFFQYIFVDKNKFYDPASLSIIEHEKVHARELHSLDLVIAELVSSLLWFNPFVYFFRNSIKANHEYLADAKVIKSGFNPLDYLVTLAKEVFKKHLIKMTSNFNYSLTKKRLIMITKIHSTKFAGLRYILTLPLLTALIFACSKRTEKEKIISANTILSIEQKQEADIPSSMPIDKNVATTSSGFGWRVHPVYKYKAFHNAIDFRAPEGSKVLATASGVAEIVKDLRNSKGKSIAEGKYIVLRHSNNFQTKYTHLSEFAVKAGDKVSLGQVIGYVGNTGFSTAPHLHYEVIKDGKNVDPKNYLGNTK